MESYTISYPGSMDENGSINLDAAFPVTTFGWLGEMNSLAYPPNRAMLSTVRADLLKKLHFKEWNPEGFPTRQLGYRDVYKTVGSYETVHLLIAVEGASLFHDVEKDYALLSRMGEANVHFSPWTALQVENHASNLAFHTVICYAFKRKEDAVMFRMFYE